MSAYDYWDELAEAESVGVPAPPPRVYRTKPSQWGWHRSKVTKRQRRWRNRKAQEERGLK